MPLLLYVHHTKLLREVEVRWQKNMGPSKKRCTPQKAGKHVIIFPSRISWAGLFLITSPPPPLPTITVLLT